MGCIWSYLSKLNSFALLIKPLLLSLSIRYIRVKQDCRPPPHKTSREPRKRCWKRSCDDCNRSNTLRVDALKRRKQKTKQKPRRNKPVDDIGKLIKTNKRNGCEKRSTDFILSLTRPRAHTSVQINRLCLKRYTQYEREREQCVNKKSECTEQFQSKGKANLEFYNFYL